MENAYLILTVIMILPLAGFVVFGANSFLKVIDPKTSNKWYAICSIVLSIISIPRAMIATYLLNGSALISWGLIVVFILTSITGILSYIEESKEVA